ncbi:class I SAM-dependent methyltransferase [Rhodobacteraceae bacterium F11138]|nr:class I SAM-dependent methyltransferase [Rhodobacteraceae bacterium F11138]
MSDTSQLTAHYDGNADLTARIKAALDRGGFRPPLKLNVLAQFDELHMGGRQATERFAANLRINAGSRVLDLGCGLGGPARFIASTTGARVTGVDLTSGYIRAGRELTGMALMLDLVELREGDIRDLPFDAQSFDVVYMIHVGMNIADKATVFEQAARVLKPGGLFGIYDVMALQDNPVQFPVPWASGQDHSALSGPEIYRDGLENAGFRILSQTDRSAFALDTFARMASRQAAAGAPPALGMHLVMGPDAASRIDNMVASLTAGRIAPVEIIAELPR